MFLDFILIVFLTAAFASAFVVHHKQHSRRIILTGYRNDWGSGGAGAENQDGAQNKVKNTRRQHVPLLGPIPGEPPLLLGGELILDPPTPMQWQTLQESVVLHQEYLNEQNDINVDTTEADNQKTTGIDAAPLVAVIDDVTGKG